MAFSQNERQISFRNLTVDEGLSQNSVVSIAQDSTGFMWFATQDGLNKYDGRNFNYIPYQFEDVTRNTYSKLGKIYIDNQYVIWIVVNSGVLYKQDKSSDKFKHIKNLKNVSTLLQDSRNNYYIGTYGSGFYTISGHTKDTVQILKSADENLITYDLFQNKNSIFASTSGGILEIQENNTYRFIEIDVEANFSAFTKSEKLKKIYLGTYGKGLFVSDESSLNFKPFTGFQNQSLPANLIIQDLLIDSNEKLWIATYGKGAYLIDFKLETIQHFVAQKGNPYALHYNDVLSLYEDFNGMIWLGTDGSGLSLYDEHLVKFNVLTNPQIPKDFNIDFVRAITKKDEEIWLGTSNKGLTVVNLQTDSFKSYTTENSTLSSNRIMSLYTNQFGLWVGHQNHGLQKLTGGNRFETFENTRGMSVWKIYGAENGNLWLCTLNGLILFNESKGILKNYDYQKNKLFSGGIRTVESGKKGELWIGTESDGLYLLNIRTDEITQIKEITDRIKSLYFHDNLLWIGTNGNGLKVYNTLTQKITHFTVEEGLANNVIYGILPDDKGNLWLSSNKGLSMVTTKGESIINFENFTSYDGLQTNEFNTGAYFKDQNGTLYFGGLEGINWFNPQNLSFSPIKPKTIISAFKVHNKTVQIEDFHKFNSKENTVTFYFSSLQYSLPERNKYKYMLENYDVSWTYSENNNSAHYTNLPPGEYTFKVFSSNYDGIWGGSPASLSFTIMKPWYLSSLALAIYLVLVILICFFIFRYFKWRLQVKMQLEREHQERQKLASINNFKTKLFNNISHEFRTPLTLITGPIENQLNKPDLSEKDQKELTLIKHNSNRLLELINQMMELSMLDSEQRTLNIMQGDLNSLLLQLIESFQYQANRRKITLQSTVQGLHNCWFDKDMMEKVFSNLLSNAIKYAPEKSSVIMNAKESEGQLILIVTNETQQLVSSDLSKLFQRFYQNNESSEGMGIGLALVKELVELAQGTITVNTIDETKIQFTVSLPVQKTEKMND